MKDVSAEVVERRIRNRRIEYLEVAASFEAQREYQRNVPIAHVPHEMIELWNDWLPKDPAKEVFNPSVYSPAEVEAIRKFHATWERVIAATPNPLPPIEETQELEAWAELRDAAAEALRILSVRGRLPED